MVNLNKGTCLLSIDFDFRNCQCAKNFLEKYFSFVPDSKYQSVQKRKQKSKWKRKRKWNSNRSQSWRDDREKKRSKATKTIISGLFLDTPPFCIMTGVKEANQKAKSVCPGTTCYGHYEGGFAFSYVRLLDFIQVFCIFSLAIIRNRLLSPVNEMLIGPITVSPLPVLQLQTFPADLESCSNSGAHIFSVLGSNGRQPLQVTHFRDADTPPNCSPCKRQARGEKL